MYVFIPETKQQFHQVTMAKIAHQFDSNPSDPFICEDIEIIQGTHKPGKNKLSKLPNESEQSLYIVGHGAPGMNRIRIGESTETPHFETGENMTAEQLVQSLKLNGLANDFCGKIKLWICSSGAEGNGNPALATLVYLALKKEGFLKCRVYGYSYTLRAKRYNEHTDTKFAVVAPIKNGSKVGTIKTTTPEGIVETLIRARDARLEFTSG